MRAMNMIAKSEHEGLAQPKGTDRKYPPAR